MFKKAWDMRLSRLKQAHAALGRDLATIDRQIDAKLDQIVECSSSTVQRAFERKVESLEREKLVLDEMIAAKPRPKRSFEKMF